jgi:hypothetical protein
MQYLDFRCRIVNYRTNEVDIAKLLEAIYDCKWDKHIHNSTMVGGYQVRYPYLEELCNNEMKKFMDEVLVDTVQQYCMQEYAVGPGEEKFGLPPISIDLTDYWINVMPPGSYQRIHSHFNSNLSGTFYLQAPEQSGDLYIPSPYINGIENIITTASEYIIPPKVREGWLHPSSLPHYVSRNESDEDRVSISYNLKLKNI